MKAMKWMVFGLVLATAGVMAQEPVPPPREGPPREGRREGPPREAMRPRGPMMGMDTEAMLMQALSPDSKIAQEIGLTEAQSQELKKLVPGAQKDMQEYREKMEKLAEEQANLLSQDTPDEVAVMKVVEQLGQMRTEIAKKRIQQVLAAQKILTPEQRAQLREKLKARMEQFREGRGMREGGFRPRREGQPPPGAPPPVAPPQPPPAVPAPPAPAK